MGKARFWSVMIPVLCCLVLAGCSGKKDADRPKTSDKTATEQTADDIRQYGKKPLDKARAAQQLGEERTNAIDEAIKKQ